MWGGQKSQSKRHLGAQIVNECRRGNFQHCDGQKFVGTTQEIIEKKEP